MHDIFASLKISSRWNLRNDKHVFQVTGIEPAIRGVSRIWSGAKIQNKAIFKSTRSTILIKKECKNSDKNKDNKTDKMVTREIFQNPQSFQGGK